MGTVDAVCSKCGKVIQWTGGPRLCVACRGMQQPSRGAALMRRIVNEALENGAERIVERAGDE